MFFNNDFISVSNPYDCGDNDQNEFSLDNLSEDESKYIQIKIKTKETNENSSLNVDNYLNFMDKLIQKQNNFFNTNSNYRTYYIFDIKLGTLSQFYNYGRLINNFFEERLHLTRNFVKITFIIGTKVLKPLVNMFLKFKQEKSLYLSKIDKVKSIIEKFEKENEFDENYEDDN